MYPNDSAALLDVNFTVFFNRSLPFDSQLYQVPVEIIVLLSVCYGFISLVSVIGNIIVLWIVASCRRMKTVTNFFIANLAVADVIIGLFSIPFQFQAALLQRWELPEFMCAFCPFVQVLSVNVSIFTLTAIALDRYRAITSPLRARCCSKFNAKVFIGIVWIASSVVALPYAVALRVTLVFDTRSGDVSRPFCINAVLPPFSWKIYNHVLVGLQYFLPLCVISYTYGMIWRAMKDCKTPGNAERTRDATITRNKRKLPRPLKSLIHGQRLNVAFTPAT
ncbi:neuropeptide Y receptor type 2-like [Ornithodoros turicata]|uniref:neuropeptide Y receptor type 2-like n=1 Tax=Ornithodoros turicata TaxID=34597 RepID=UPI00313A1E7C